MLQALAISAFVLWVVLSVVSTWAIWTGKVNP